MMEVMEDSEVWRLNIELLPPHCKKEFIVQNAILLRSKCDKRVKLMGGW